MPDQMQLCGQIHDPIVEFPDVGDGMCCYGSAVYGPERCTCWEPVYDQEQAAPNLSDAEPRDHPCDDCAFRSDSPESRGDPSYNEYHFNPRIPFFCHRGMRRIVEYRHPVGGDSPRLGLRSVGSARAGGQGLQGQRSGHQLPFDTGHPETVQR